MFARQQRNAINNLLCFYIQSSLLYCQDVKTGPCKQKFISEEVQLLLREKYQFTEDSIFHTTSYVSYNGITFKSSAFVLISYDVFEPIFGKIIAVVKTEREEIILVLKEFVARFYDSHYRAYSIRESVCHHLYNVKSLPYYSIFHHRRTFSVDNNLYITFRYHIES